MTRRRWFVTPTVVLGFATMAIVIVALIVHRGNVLGVCAVAATLIVLERGFALREQPALRSEWSTDIVHLIVNRALSGAAVLAVLVAIAASLRPFLSAEVPIAISGQPGWLQLIEALWPFAVQKPVTARVGSAQPMRVAARSQLVSSSST